MGKWIKMYGTCNSGYLHVYKTFSNGNTFHMKVNRLKPKTNILEGVQTKVHTYKSADSELPPLAHNNSLKFSVTMSMGYAVHSTPCNMSNSGYLKV